jgi:hypothetical protein
MLGLEATEFSDQFLRLWILGQIVHIRRLIPANASFQSMALDGASRNHEICRKSGQIS